MLYALYKVTPLLSGVRYQLKEDGLTSIADALAAAPRHGWGEYRVSDAREGRTVARLKLAPPLVSDSLPVEAAEPVGVAA